MKTKTSEAEGWGLRVGGQRPYLAYEIQRHKNQIKLTESYHRAVRVVLIPAQEWERLKKEMKEVEKKIWRLHIFMAKDNEKYHLHQDRKKKEKVEEEIKDELGRLIDPEPLYNMPPPKMEKNEKEIDILRGK